MLELPPPDGVLSAWDVKGVAAIAIGELSLPGIEGLPLDPGDIWPVVIFASVNQTSVREVSVLVDPVGPSAVRLMHPTSPTARTDP